MSQTEGATVYLTYDELQQVRSALLTRPAPGYIEIVERIDVAIGHLNHNRSRRHGTRGVDGKWYPNEAAREDAGDFGGHSF